MLPAFHSKISPVLRAEVGESLAHPEFDLSMSVIIKVREEIFDNDWQSPVAARREPGHTAVTDQRLYGRPIARQIGALHAGLSPQATVLDVQVVGADGSGLTSHLILDYIERFLTRNGNGLLTSGEVRLF